MVTIRSKGLDFPPDPCNNKGMKMKNETTMTDSAVLSVIASFDGDKVDAFEMTYGELSDWVAYGYAYDEYDSILVNGVEASDLVA
jgi:hypothetical protein